MNIIKYLIYNIGKQDSIDNSNYPITWIIYLTIFIILFLENGLLLAAFLPGDSLLILLGVLISQKILNFFITLFILTFAAGLGSWMSYLQGQWLKKSKVINSWLLTLPFNYHNRAYNMFHRHGLSALLIGRFIAFIRTLLPIVAGLSNLKSTRFHLFNWMSAFLWVLILMSVGFTFGKTSIFQRHENEFMFCLIFLPLVLLSIGLISSLVMFCKRKKT